MKKIRVQERDGDVWNSRTSLIRCHLSGDKELREQAMHTPEGRASAKALRQEQAWCVSRNSREATVATAERARREGEGSQRRQLGRVLWSRMGPQRKEAL